MSFTTPPPMVYSEYRSANGISEMNLLARQGFIYVDTIPVPTMSTAAVAFLMVRTRFVDDEE